MLLRKFMGLAVCALIIASASAAVAGIPDLDLSSAARAYTGSEVLSLMSLPNGAGKAFNQAFLPGGSEADATITLTLLDGLGAPIANFPFEDMWIEAADGGLVSCGGNAVANFNTDAAGQTQWANPLFAGGFSVAACLVKVNGDALAYDAQISFNSPDISGDGVVNLTDAGYFSQDRSGAYNYRSDFNNDAVVNLTDAGYMGNALGVSCP